MKYSYSVYKDGLEFLPYSMGYEGAVTKCLVTFTSKIFAFIEESARRYDSQIEEVEVQEDYALVGLRPSVAHSQAVQLMNWYTIRVLFVLERK